MKLVFWANNQQTYESRPVVREARVVKGMRQVMPKAPCGCAVPVGYVLNDDGNYERETSYRARHALVFFQRRVTL